VNFALLPWAAVLAGGGLIAALLYLLQRLQARRRSVHLPTAMLWQQVARELPPRVLGRRFHRWLAWLLSVLIALLLWLAFAGPQATSSGDGQRQLFYLDASAWMLSDGAFEQARDALVADVARVPAAQREVHLGDAGNSVLLRAGEPLALLSKRLQGVHAQANPSGFGRWLAAIAGERPASQTLQVRYYGAQAELAMTGRAPAGIDLLYGHLATVLPRNRGIVNFGVAAAASGDARKVDVLLELAASGMPLPRLDALHFVLDGRRYVPAAVLALAPGKWLLRDVAGAGGELAVTLDQDDDFAADDSARLRLPQRAPIRVALEAGVPASVRDAIELDPGLQIVAAAQAQVSVQLAARSRAGTLPTLLLADPASQHSAFVFGYVSATEQDALRASLPEIGVSQVMNAALAEHLQRAVGVDLLPMSQRTVAVWASVFAPDSPFAQSRQMPLFIAHSLRWLAGPHAPGSARPASLDPAIPALIAEDDAYRLEDVADAAAADTAGHVAQSLLNRQITLGVASAVSPLPPLQRPQQQLSALAGMWQLALLSCLLLLALEWRLYQRGWMP
jgi:hypothetical protein